MASRVTDAAGVRTVAMLTVVAIGLVALGIYGWRSSQLIDVVIVNRSGRTIDYAWQPQAFDQMEVVERSGCESSMNEVNRLLDWRITDNDGTTILDAASVDIPFTARHVALEVWLDADGSTRIVPPREVTETVDAPNPNC